MPKPKPIPANDACTFEGAPDYPTQFVQDLRNKNGITPGKDEIVEIGTGLGKLTDKLLDCNVLVYGVEPGPTQQKIAERHLENEDFISIKGDAVQTNIPRGSQGRIKAIFVGQALHYWRDQFNDVVQSWNRLLNPGGRLVALTYHFNDKNALCQEMDGIFLKHGRDYKDRPAKMLYANSPAFADSEHERYFMPGEAKCEALDLEFFVNIDQFKNLAPLICPALKKDQKNLVRVHHKMTKLFNDMDLDKGRIAVPYVLKAWYGPLITPQLIAS